MEVCLPQLALGVEDFRCLLSLGELVLLVELVVLEELIVVV